MKKMKMGIKRDVVELFRKKNLMIFILLLNINEHLYETIKV